MWEDPTNRQGGKWVLTIPKARKNQVDQWWMYTVIDLHFSSLTPSMPFLQILLLIGENLNDDEDVCGAVVSVRKGQDRIALWTKTASDGKLQVIYQSMH